MSQPLQQFARYDAYKDSGVEWLGDIPQDWGILPLKYLATVQTGNTPSKTSPLNFSTSEGTPWVKPDELNEFVKIHSTKEFITAKGISEARVIPANSVLVCCIGTIGKMGVSGTILTTNQQINSLIFGKYTHFDYAKYVVFTSKPQHERLANGNVVSILNASSQKTIKLPVPPLPEQTAIANFLDQKTAEIDQAIALKTELIERLKEYKQITIQHAVTRGLDPNATMKASGVEWIGDIPAHWEISRSKYVFAQRIERSRKDDVQLSATQAYGVIPQDEYEKIIGRKVVKISLHLDKRKRVHIDDFVISMRSFQGGLERAWASGCIRSSYVVLKAVRQINTDFFAYLFKIPKYIKALQSTGSFIRDGQDLNFENFSKIDLFIPPSHEQEAIVAMLNAKLPTINIAIDQAQQQIDKLSEYKTVLINAAVTGKIKVA